MFTVFSEKWTTWTLKTDQALCLGPGHSLILGVLKSEIQGFTWDQSVEVTSPTKKYTFVDIPVIRKRSLFFIQQLLRKFAQRNLWLEVMEVNILGSILIWFSSPMQGTLDIFLGKLWQNYYKDDPTYITHSELRCFTVLRHLFKETIPICTKLLSSYFEGEFIKHCSLQTEVFPFLGIVNKHMSVFSWKGNLKLVEIGVQ